MVLRTWWGENRMEETSGSSLELSEREPSLKPGRSCFHGQRGHSGARNGWEAAVPQAWDRFFLNTGFRTPSGAGISRPASGSAWGYLGSIFAQRSSITISWCATGCKRVDEIPFGAIERISSQEFPAQNWFDYGNGTQGVAVLNRGLPGSNVVDGTLLLSLMRSARITAYPFVEGYEPGVSSDSGLELGKRLTFDYALVPQ